MGSNADVNVLVADRIAAEGVARLRGAGVGVDVRPDIPIDALLTVIGDYEGIIVRSRTKVTRPVIAAGRRLVVIGRAGSGMDNIDVEFARARGIAVVNAPTAVSLATAEFTVGLLFALARNIPQAHHSTKRGLWEKERLTGVQLAGKTLGVIGFGRIGRRVAELARAVGMEVLVCDPYIDPGLVMSADAAPVALPELLARSDFITVHVPLSPDTRSLLGPREFAAMRDGVRIVNCSRGGVVDEEALYQALVSGKVSGAALDVFEQEPPVSSPLLNLDRVIVTPHLGGSSAEAQRAAAVEVADRVIDALGLGALPDRGSGGAARPAGPRFRNPRGDAAGMEETRHPMANATSHEPQAAEAETVR